VTTTCCRREARAVAIARTLVAAEAVGAPPSASSAPPRTRRCREQFGRPIGMFQAVKHHCANMLVAAELGTATTWDAARAASGPAAEFELAAATALTLAVPAFADNAQLNIQVHGGSASPGSTTPPPAAVAPRRSRPCSNPSCRRGRGAPRAGGRHRDTTNLELPPEAEAARESVRDLAPRAGRPARRGAAHAA